MININKLDTARWLSTFENALKGKKQRKQNKKTSFYDGGEFIENIGIALSDRKREPNSELENLAKEIYTFEEQVNTRDVSESEKGMDELMGKVEGIITPYWAEGKMEDGDVELIYECIKQYALRYLSGKKSIYYDWQTVAEQMIHFGEIAYRLPNNAKVAIIGDWGSGLEDAKLLLHNIVKIHKPDAIIHLGDIYYSGTIEEANNNFLKVFQSVFHDTKHKCPIFNLPGNHDYYAFGEGFYDILPRLNPDFPTAKQEASYFSLKTQNGKWQFLGIDTGFNDGNVFEAKDGIGPDLNMSEKDWVKYHLDHHHGKTILLSHHQLFSARDILSKAQPYLNKCLYNIFYPYFKDKIAAWFWGHEHNLVFYQDDLLGLKKGRLVGSSSFREPVKIGTSNPYHIKYNEIHYLCPPTEYKQRQLELRESHGYYYHGYAILAIADEAVDARYYDFPAAPHIEKKAALVEREIYQEVIQ